MGKYNRQRFTNTTLRRDLLKKLDALKQPNDSRNDVLERLLSSPKPTVRTTVSLERHEPIEVLPPTIPDESTPTVSRKEAVEEVPKEHPEPYKEVGREAPKEDVPDEVEKSYRKFMASGRGSMGFKGYWRALGKSDEQIEEWLKVLRRVK